MAPAQFLDDDIAIDEYLSYVDGMVASYLVIRHALIFRRVIILEVTLIYLFFQRSKFGVR